MGHRWAVLRSGVVLLQQNQTGSCYYEGHWPVHCGNTIHSATPTLLPCRRLGMDYSMVMFLAVLSIRRSDKAARCALPVCDDDRVGDTDSVPVSVPPVWWAVGEFVYHRSVAVHNRGELRDMVLLAHERHGRQGVGLDGMEVDHPLPLRLDRVWLVHHRHRAVHPPHLRVLPPQDPGRQQGQQDRQVHALLHLLLPRLSRALHQVHHQERLHPSRTHQQELLSLRLQRLPPRHQKRIPLRLRPHHRRALHVPGQMHDHRCQCRHMLCHDDSVVEGRGLSVVALLPMHNSWLHRLHSRRAVHEHLLLRLRHHPPVLPPRRGTRSQRRRTTTRQQTTIDE